MKLVNGNQNIINYICNACQQKRMAIVPQFLQIKVDDRGLCEMVDVHECKDSEIRANILFIDELNAVRSQVSISSEEKEEKKPDISSLNIPIPDKAELSEQLIIIDKRFKRNIIKEILIIDKLRHIKFKTEKEEGDSNYIYVISPLGFIEINVSVSKKIDKVQAFIWMQEVVNLLEEVVLLDERVYKHLYSYIEEKIKEKINSERIKELTFLLSSPISIPISNQEFVDTFKENADEIFTDIAYHDHSYYLYILNESKDNEKKALVEIIDSMLERVSIGYILSALRNIVDKFLLKLEKIQFITVSG